MAAQIQSESQSDYGSRQLTTHSALQQKHNATQRRFASLRCDDERGLFTLTAHGTKVSERSRCHWGLGVQVLCATECTRARSNEVQINMYLCWGSYQRYPPSDTEAPRKDTDPLSFWPTSRIPDLFRLTWPQFGVWPHDIVSAHFSLSTVDLQHACACIILSFLFAFCILRYGLAYAKQQGAH